MLLYSKLNRYLFSKMKKYSSYKDPEIKWIGNIPEHWNVIRSRFVFNIVSGNGFPEDLQGKSSGDYPFYKCSDINFNGVFADQANNYVDETDVRDNKWSIIPQGSIIFAKIGEALKKNHRKINSSDCLIDNNMMAVVLKDASSSIKYYYFLMCLIKMEWFVNPGAVPSVDVSKFRSFFIPRIDTDEQKRIECYLDRKTTQVDSLIDKKERMIELLKEERAAIINKTVTKGLDPSVEMKNSGIEWLGKVPKHWGIKKLQYLGRFQNGISESSEYFGSGYPFISYGDVYNNMALPDKITGLAQSSDEERRRMSVKEGDTFFTRTSETIDEIGISSVCIRSIKDAVFSGFLIRFRPSTHLLTKEFSKYYFRSIVTRKFFVKEMNIVTRASLAQDLLKKLPVLLPSFLEQKEIFEYLENKSNQIDTQIFREQKLIKLLKEYRTALISEVVTGKIDVREYVA